MHTCLYVYIRVYIRIHIFLKGNSQPHLLYIRINELSFWEISSLSLSLSLSQYTWNHPIACAMGPCWNFWGKKSAQWSSCKVSKFVFFVLSSSQLTFHLLYKIIYDTHTHTHTHTRHTHTHTHTPLTIQDHTWYTHTMLTDLFEKHYMIHHWIMRCWAEFLKKKAWHA